MFIAYEVTKELIVSLRDVVITIERKNKECANQLFRAANSVLLNLGEGQKFNNGNRRKYYEIAQGSANEVKGALDAAECWGWLTTRGPEREILSRLLAILWKLTHSPAILALPRGRASQ